ncbi:Uncharacterized protein GNX_2434 [Leptospira interrogans serovar Canicola]|nr:Uncharacterized protein GNX_2434 [Leptospira interrogans serovar Canicola]
MFRNLWKDIQWSFRSVPLVLKEWLTFYLSFSGRFQEFWKEKSISEKGLFITLTLQLLFSLSTWIEYTINLGGEETEGLRVSSNFYFIFSFRRCFFSLVRFGALYWLDIFSFECSISSRLRCVSRYFLSRIFFL